MHFAARRCMDEGLQTTMFHPHALRDIDHYDLPCAFETAVKKIPAFATYILFPHAYTYAHTYTCTQQDA